MRSYKNIWHRQVEGLAPGKTGTLELTAPEEAEYLAWGRLELQPIEYEVVGPKRVCDTDPAGKFTAALTIGQEAHLVASGHIAPAEAKRADKDD